MTPLDQGLAYAAHGSSVFPCRSQEPGRKRPFTPRGFLDASTSVAAINAWWRRWPDALIGMPTGLASGLVVLDIDAKRAETNGYDSLEDLGCAVLANTPMVHTASGGLHLYFAVPPGGLRNTGGNRGRGIGPGLDWRGDGGYVIVPSPNCGYAWDPHWNFETASLAEIPMVLLPRGPEKLAAAEAVKLTPGLSPYAEQALDSACRNILVAPAGEQEATLNGECFSIGTLAGAGGIPVDFARRVLIWAAQQVQSYDQRRPWHSRDLETKVNRAFDVGVYRPRDTRHG
jgi:putative DNA primase/helicase